MPNRLQYEKSPYLLQHADNPVDWYPWGDEAFQKAKAENKPVFVSIGYSTCHWCHVMAHESFEDEEVATILNTHFVSIKVDREERPDIDSVYMTVCQALTGHGGWPLSVFMTPEQKPFYAGTYFPKESRFGQPGFIDILLSIADQYKDKKDKLETSGSEIIEALSRTATEATSIHKNLPAQCFDHFQEMFDHTYGGFGDAPKFPSPHQLLFLLRYYRWKGDPAALDMVEKTLEGMANGGIYDHIGGGFARYAVDRAWLIPHFEKMLYDQAMLMMVYTEAWQITQQPRWEKIVDAIFTYITRTMQDEKGGFYSAEDADAEGVEGKFYVWTPNEIIGELGDRDGALYCRVYDITEKGNFEGASVPNLINVSFEKIAEAERLTVQELVEKLDGLNQKLFKIREGRVHPHKDDKVLTAWNGLMIAAIATAARAFQREDYLKTAEEAFQFIDQNMFLNGELYARYRDGEVKVTAFLDDYAYFMWACDALYDATYQPKYLVKMKQLADQLITRFWDPKHYGFFLNCEEELVMRPKDIYDGALPSGNSVAAMMLLKLARRTGHVDYEMYVDKIFNGFGTEVNHYPMGYAWLLSTFMLAEQGTKELVVLFDDNHEDAVPAEIQTAFLPEVVTLVGAPPLIGRIATFTKDFQMMNQRPTYYLCEHFQCRRPTTDAQEVLDSLR
ncbi:thioredoxin domain-containing protein [Camelliibacillus cellulosilyticus]|uniref:Thioredoxin domain-containing protein n=1 Tax=Camelliibacillus cellulosilyticus TaxID=2174486 RepID=A0ABV9GM08_9BACL